MNRLSPRQSSRRKAVLRQCLLFCVTVTLSLILAGSMLYAIDPLLSLPHLLQQICFGLLVWRLCLYTTCAAGWLSLYRRFPPEQRPRLRRTAMGFLVLVALNELCIVLQ